MIYQNKAWREETGSEPVSKKGMAKQLTVKELRYLLFKKVENQDAPVAFYDSKRGKLLPLIAINEAVDHSVVTLGFYDEKS